MKNKINESWSRMHFRNLRTLPVVVLLLLVALFVLHLRSRTAFHGRYYFAGLNMKSATDGNFSSFSGEVCEVLHEGSAGQPQREYRIASSQKTLNLACRIRYRIQDSRAVRVAGLWYRENQLVFSDTLSLSPNDSLARTVHSLSRNEAGLWSVDLVLMNGKILHTIVFNIILVKHTRPFRSLMKKESIKEE